MRKQLAIALLGVVMTVSGVLSGPAYTALAAEESGTGEQAEAAADEAPAAEQQEADEPAADEAPVKQDASAEEEETVEVTAEESGAEAETMEPALQVADASGMEAAAPAEETAELTEATLQAYDAAAEEELAEAGTGQLMAAKQGLVTSGSRTVYYKAGGKMAVSEFITVSGKLYYFDKAGASVKNKWIEVKGKWYHFDKKGAALKGWTTNKNGTYYFADNYVMVTGFRYIGRNQYYFRSNGKLATGWQTINGFRYYMDSKGVIAKGFKTVKGKTYYFYPKTSGKKYAGTMAKGWLNLNGKAYYMDQDGSRSTGWKTVSGHKYYFNKNGEMVTGWQTIGGKTYYFNKQGRFVVSCRKTETSMARIRFIETVGQYCRKYAPKYGIKCYSAVIAQAILESGWGKSKLSAKYHNYFGLKCGSKWKGKAVSMRTGEEYDGRRVTISAYFRAYPNMEQGIKGYFDFINTARYSNLKGVTSPKTYLSRIKADGYATSSNYVSSNMSIVNSYGLKAYDPY